MKIGSSLAVLALLGNVSADRVVLMSIADKLAEIKQRQSNDQYSLAAPVGGNQEPEPTKQEKAVIKA